MKQILFFLIAASFFIACKNKSISGPETNKNMVLVDTTGLYKSNALTDVGKQVDPNSSGNNNVGYNTTSYSRSKASSHATTVTPRDRGWSDAAKGTAIGVGTGALIGALVSKNKGKGIILGTLIGGGGGYLIGRARDRKSGRVARQKAKKRARTY